MCRPMSQQGVCRLVEKLDLYRPYISQFQAPFNNDQLSRVLLYDTIIYVKSNIANLFERHAEQFIGSHRLLFSTVATF